jgi:hypothetical protein
VTQEEEAVAFVRAVADGIRDEAEANLEGQRQTMFVALADLLHLQADNPGRYGFRLAHRYCHAAGLAALESESEGDD